jgi:hypothetical protein
MLLRTSLMREAWQARRGVWAPDLVALVTSSFFDVAQGNETKSGPALVNCFPLPLH